MTNTAYVVTEGCYSDYHICGVFSTLEKAQEAKEFYQADTIEEFPLDFLPAPSRVCHRYGVRMDSKGKAVFAWCLGKERGREPEWKLLKGKQSALFCMWAEGQEQAIQLANERRLALLASGQWTTNSAHVAPSFVAAYPSLGGFRGMDTEE